MKMFACFRVPALTALCALPCLAPMARAQTSVYPQVSVSGSFNEWDTLTPNMLLIADNTWQGDFTITNQYFEFKFSTPNFTNNWGDNNQANIDPPVSGTAEISGNNIQAVNGTDNSLFRFTINTSTREFSAFLLNNVGSNLLFNASFEEQGSEDLRARYWELNQPNLHGGYNGPANRTSYGTPFSGTNVMSILGTWGGLGNSGSVWQEAPVEAGVPYLASAWFQSESAWSSGVQELRLEFYDFTKAYQLASYVQTIPTNILWSQVAVTGSAPARSAWGRLVCNVAQAGQSASLRMDAASVQAAAARRTEDFNDWTGYADDGDHMRAGWRVSTGKMVSSYIYGPNEIPLARSGLAASLSNPGAAASNSFIQSPRFQNGLGAISFYYRHGYEGDPADSPDEPVRLLVQVSFLGDYWTTVGEVNNIYNTTYRRFDLFQYITSPYYMRIVHNGGSTNRLLIDDIAIADPEATPRMMDFNSWPSSGTNVGYHQYVEWTVSTGIVSTLYAKSGKCAHIFGNQQSNSYLSTPFFSNGYSTIGFSYRRGLSGFNTFGLSLESSTNDVAWTVLDVITNISTLSWIDYSREFFQPIPNRIRIRNLRETNVLENASASLDEPFDGGATPPAGWTFYKIGQYTTASSSGRNPPSLKFADDSPFIITPLIINPTNVTFMTLGQGISTDSYLIVEGSIGGIWFTNTVIRNLTNSKITRSVHLTNTIEQLRFTYIKMVGNMAFDDLIVTGVGATGGVNSAQTLLLDDVNIEAPVEYRTQDFDTWPLKMDPTNGVTQHQNWMLFGNSQVNTNKAFSGQSLQLSRAGGAVDYYVDFEKPTETTPNDYASNNITLSEKPWIFIQAITGPQPNATNDWYNGTHSARLRGYGTSSMTMIADITNGLGAISFNYRCYGTDAQADWLVQYSTNGGSTWIQAGSSFTAPVNTNVQTFSATVNVYGRARIRIKRATESGSSNKRLNIDDILLTGFGGGSGTDAFVQSHYFPDGVGPISFQYRHWMDSPPPSESIVTAQIQTSTNGTSWNTVGSLLISNSAYRLYEKYLSESNQHYARILLAAGNSVALFDNIAVALPQPPASLQLSGWHSPNNPYTNDIVTLYAEALANYSAHSVSITAYYRIGTTGVFQAMAMIPNGSTYNSVTNIPPKPPGTIVQYYFRADFMGPGSEITSPVYYPTNYATAPTWYGIPRNPPGMVWINEIDYNAFDWNEWEDFEFVELAGRSGVNISGWRIELRDGRTSAYRLFDSYTLPTTVIQNQTNEFGFFVLANAALSSPPRNITLTNVLAMRIPGAVRLLNEMGGVEHSLSYGGTVPSFTRIGPEDVEPGDVPSNCVFLTGSGTSAVNFSWVNKDTFLWTNKASTPGASNLGQTFVDPSRMIAIPTNLVFSYVPGSFDPAAQLLVVSNSGTVSFSYNATTNVNWLSISPVSIPSLAPGGTISHTVTVHTAGLVGERNGQITLSGTAANSPVAVAVKLVESALATPIILYHMDDSPDITVYNDGSAGSSANLIRQEGTAWTLEGGGVSGKLGDFALGSVSSNSHARSSTNIPALNNVTQFTVSGWIKTTSTNGNRLLMGNRVLNQGFAVQTASNGQDIALLSSAGTVATAVSATNGGLVNGQWQFFAIVFDATDAGSSAVRFYRGGVSNSAYLASTRPRGDLNATGNSTGQLFVAGTLSNSCLGIVDELRFYSGIHDNVDIEAIRREGAVRGGDTPVPPYIITQPPSTNYWVYTIQTLGVVADGSPTPQYIWRQNGVILPSKTENTIVFNPLLLTDDGDYDVIVYNVAGIITSQVAKLLVLAVPEVLTPPMSQTVYVGETALISVNATGTPPLKYQWYYGASLMNGQTNPSLYMNNIATNQAGFYSIVVSNYLGVSNSASAMLTVRYLDFKVGGGGGLQQSPGSNGVVVRWPSIPNRLYGIWWCSNLGTGSFDRIVATNIPATPAINAYTDKVYGVKNYGFYRIWSETPP